MSCETLRYAQRDRFDDNNERKELVVCHFERKRLRSMPVGIAKHSLGEDIPQAIAEQNVLHNEGTWLSAVM